MSWNVHVKHEHNFRKLIEYFVYLMELDDRRCNVIEERLKSKLKLEDESLFQDLEVKRMLN